MGFSFVGPVDAQPCVLEPCEGRGQQQGWMGRREELFWEVVYGSDGGLQLVFVGALCSSAVTIHGQSTFLLLLESRDHSIAQAGRDPKDRGVPAPKAQIPGLRTWKSSLAFSLQMKGDFSIP